MSQLSRRRHSRPDYVGHENRVLELNELTDRTKKAGERQWILDQGEVVVVSNRRMFERDETRFFVGRTIVCEGPLLKAEGFTFVKDLSNGHIIRKEEKRIKVLSLNSPGHIVYQLPSDVDVANVNIESGNGDAYMVDGSKKLLNLTERTHCGQF